MQQKPYDFVETVKYQNMTATEAFQKYVKTRINANRTYCDKRYDRRICQ